MEVFVDGCEYGDILGHKCRNGADEDPDINYVGHWLLRISDAALKSKEPRFWSAFKKEGQYLVSVDDKKKYCPQIFSHLENVLIQKGRHREAREVGSIGARIRVEKKYGNDPCIVEKIQRCGLKAFSHLTSHSYSIKWVIFVSLLIIYGGSFFYKWAYHNDMMAFSSDIIGLEESRVLPLGGNSEVRDDEWGCFVFSVFGFHDYKTCRSCINAYSEGVNKKYGSWPPYNYVEFNPFLYSLDVFLPIVDIGQERFWGPTTSGPWTTIWFLRVFQILTGWVFSGLVVAYFSGVMRKSY
ncbi:hypothetical protein SAMN05421508_10326 [Caenispirillum bisanense]|uniref:Uncharacterized protein n=2 Tax=Caenispirillum bisanense TaxID=414052 RepID=A0A286GCQ4_9PROT|nr:hypothetical protein SAMN05421508_10326 [Caenispirillum bisanense]